MTSSFLCRLSYGTQSLVLSLYPYTIPEEEKPSPNREDIIVVPEDCLPVLTHAGDVFMDRYAKHS